MVRAFAIICLFCTVNLVAQSEIKTNQGFLFIPHYAYQTPGGDLKERFKPFSSIGLGVDYKFKNKLMVGVDYDWYFGNSVNEIGTFSEITSTSGQIIDKNGDFSIIRLNMKGHYATVNIGYLLSLPSNEPNSGILFSVGTGFMLHKIDILSSQVTIPQVNGDYEYGYDKLTYGLATKQYIGYQYLVNKNKYHVRAGIEFNQGFTQGRRTWDFNANKSGLDKRFDTTIALKLGIIVPVYTKKAEDEEFFTD
ncbi:MAG: hypothetical protein COA58_10245 [Bacteroidetes bacterium]|nr:MAG: hypothetical protein COA58_10245 [Bacteroidota bacterium]